MLCQPFTDFVWLGIIVTTTIIAFAKIFTAKSKNVIGTFWATFVANFGGYFEGNLSQMKAFKFIVFLTLFWGNVIWMAYQASLTVELTNSEQKIPFRDMNEFLYSDWKLFTIGKR